MSSGRIVEYTEETGNSYDFKIFKPLHNLEIREAQL